MIVQELEQEGHGCPTSWNFFTDGGRAAYIRYRGGQFNLNVRAIEGDPQPEDGESLDWFHIYNATIGGCFDGFLDWNVAYEHIKDLDVKKEIALAVVAIDEHSRKMHGSAEYRRNYWYKWMRGIWEGMAKTTREMNELNKPGSGGHNYVPPEDQIEEEAIKHADKKEAQWQVEHDGN